MYTALIPFCHEQLPRFDNLHLHIFLGMEWIANARFSASFQVNIYDVLYRFKGSFVRWSGLWGSGLWGSGHPSNGVRDFSFGFTWRFRLIQPHRKKVPSVAKTKAGNPI